MPTTVFRDQVKRLVDEGAQLVEVLPAEEAMRSDPATFRANEPVEKTAKRMRHRGASAVLVTTSDGELMGCSTGRPSTAWRIRPETGFSWAAFRPETRTYEPQDTR